MAHVCPWWFVFTFDNPFRKLLYRPEQLFAEQVAAGARVLDIGCGAGYNTVGLAHLVGSQGAVVAVDLQSRMLQLTRRRLRRAQLEARVTLTEASRDDLQIRDSGPFSFANAFWMVHEVRETEAFFAQIQEVLAPGATVLICEPKLHVSERTFEDNLQVAIAVGFVELARPEVPISRAVLLAKPIRDNPSTQG